MAPIEEMKKHVSITLDDGCAYTMNPGDGNPEGWNADLPMGFSITCPHGYVVCVKIIGGKATKEESKDRDVDSGMPMREKHCSELTTEEKLDRISRVVEGLEFQFRDIQNIHDEYQQHAHGSLGGLY